MTQLQLTSGSQIVGGQHQQNKRPGGTSLDNLIPPMFSGQLNKPKPAPQQPAGSGIQKVRVLARVPNFSLQNDILFQPGYEWSVREPWGVNTSKESNEQCHYNVNIIDEGLKQLAALNTTFIFSAEIVPFVRELIPAAKFWIGEVESKELKLIVMLLAILVFGVFRFLSNHVRSKELSS